jgi:hypothetical protein
MPAGANIAGMTNESMITTCSGLVSGLRSTEAHSKPSSRRLLGDLEHPGDVFRHLGPNWYTSIMGTGIVANAAASLPVQFPGLRTAATIVWAFAALMLVALSGAWTVHWIQHRETAKGHARNPVMAQFWGAPPMALMTVGDGTPGSPTV